ncbi:MAG: ABC transporter ATP-binding protein [Cytophagales bacterium]|nr:MAG: ABC transporter ATP-binding protein [Cytophagales bacterium]
MEVLLENISKKYFKEWIFKNLHFQFISKESYAVIGANGSGKSTFLQVIAGIIPPTSGKINYRNTTVNIDNAHVYQYLSIVAPYQSLIEEFTLKEMYEFHFSFKKKRCENISFQTWLEELMLSKSANKSLAHFSSGMKQRVKLGLAFYSENSLLLLDEPTSNLDSQGIDWYKVQVEKIKGKSTLIICSNQIEEYEQCAQRLTITDWK